MRVSCIAHEDAVNLPASAPLEPPRHYAFHSLAEARSKGLPPMTGLLLCLAALVSSLLIALAASAAEGRCR